MSFSITQIKHNTNTIYFQLLVKGRFASAIYNSFIHLLPTALYNKDKTGVIFTASSVSTLEEHLTLYKNNCLPLNNWCQMLDTISRQMSFLKNNDFHKKLSQAYGFFGVNLNDIVVINESIFVICSSSKLLSIQEDIGRKTDNTVEKNMLYLFVDTPIQKPYFSSPEVHNIQVLPSFLPYNSFYYALGTLMYFCLCREYLIVGNDFKTTEEMREEILCPILGTKLSAFFERCFENNAENRGLMFI